MTDETVQLQKQRIMPIMEFWVHKLGLGTWKIDTHLLDGPIPDHGPATATCHPLWRYQSAAIQFNLEIVEELSDDSLEEVIVHELMHVMLSGLAKHDMSKRTEEMHEFTATILARAFMWVRGENDGRSEETTTSRTNGKSGGRGTKGRTSK